jgi:hypothetical protein
MFTGGINRQITYAQKARLDAFISNKGNIGWNLFNNCSGFATRAFNYTTGSSIMGHPFMIPVYTPKFIGRYVLLNGGF